MTASKQSGQESGRSEKQAEGPPTATATHRFGSWSFNADTGDLSGDSVTRLEPRVAALLRYFLDHQQQLVTREELVATVWEGRTVTDDAITRCVSILRQLLSPDDKQRFIETVVRKGYIAHFPPPPEQASPKQSRRPRPIILWLGAVAGLLAIAFSLMLDNPGGGGIRKQEVTSPGPPMVAVLPFATSGDNSDSAFFAAGIFEDLLTQLSQLQTVRVISSTSAREYSNVARNIREIGLELGADIVIEGSVQLAGDRIRVNAQLIDARSDEHLWAQSYDRDLTLTDMFDIQREIASAIASQTHTTLTWADQQRLALIPTRNMAAYRAYHRAIAMRENTGYSAIGQPEYIQALEEAVALDPTFTRALAELVSTLAFADFKGDRPDMTHRAEQALEQLQATAPGSADHLIGQSAYVYYALKDFDRAHDILSQALQLSPSNVIALQMKSWIERRQGDFDGYLKTRYEARRLDPRDPQRTDDLLVALLVMHRYEEVWRESEASTLQSYTIAHTRLLHQFSQDGDLYRLQAGVMQLCQRYQETDCGWIEHVASRDYSGALATLGTLEEIIDSPHHSTEARRWLYTLWLIDDYLPLTSQLEPWKAKLIAGLESVEPFHRSLFYLELGLLAVIEGDTESALEWLQRWELQNPVDLATRTMRRHEACRMLGMLAATRAAVQCLRAGLAETSLVLPFFEPLLPFYDGVRDAPEFTTLLQELEMAYVE